MSSMESGSTNNSTNQGWIYSILVLLSVGGVAIMDYSEKWGFYYWLLMAVVFGAVSIGLAWKRDQDTPGDQSDRVKKQALHWGTLMLGILLIFLMGGPAIKALKDYEAQKAAGVSRYRFDPKAMGIKGATFWEQRAADHADEQA